MIILLVLISAAVSAAQTSPPAGNSEQQAARVPDLRTILTRMENAEAENRASYRPYVVSRQYLLFGEDAQKPSSEVLADVSFVPPGTKSYQIEKTVGSSHGEKIVRRILDKESEMAGDHNSCAISRENYDFQLLGMANFQGHPSYLVQLAPKRKDKDLVKGRAWVDAQTFLIHRIDGEPSKTPSWWLKDVHVTLDFSSVEGMWLQTSTHASADVRLFGKHHLSSRALNYRTSEEVASTAGRPAASGTKSKKNTRSPASAVGAGIILDR